MCSIISINTQGLGSDDRRQTAFNFFKRHRHDIIFVQETHWTDKKNQQLNKIGTETLFLTTELKMRVELPS